MGEFSISHVLILTLVLLIFFGPSRLPALGQSIGKAIKGFKDGMNEVHNDLEKPNIPPNPITPSTTPTNSQISDLPSDDLTIKKDDKSHQNNS